MHRRHRDVKRRFNIIQTYGAEPAQKGRGWEYRIVHQKATAGGFHWSLSQRGTSPHLAAGCLVRTVENANHDQIVCDSRWPISPLITGRTKWLRSPTLSICRKPFVNFKRPIEASQQRKRLRQSKRLIRARKSTMVRFWRLITNQPAAARRRSSKDESRGTLFLGTAAPSTS